MAKYLTATQLGILPEERKALIAFAISPALGRTISVNGKAHYYNQGYAENSEAAKSNECGTAGCVAGFVFAHVRHVQKKKSLRGARSADSYINAAVEDKWIDAEPVALIPLLSKLYEESDEDRSLVEARRVVDKMLRFGTVRWRETR